MTKVQNILPSRRSEICDTHHELCGQHIAGRVLVFPSCVGSTHTGLVVLDLLVYDRAPAALVVQKADPLLVSGVLLAQVWYGKSIPVLECAQLDLFERVRSGEQVAIEEDQLLLQG
jgi:predicted aconitase with swiveling domain